MANAMADRFANDRSPSDRPITTVDASTGADLAWEGGQVTPDEYMREIVEPSIEEMVANRSSRRRAFIACVVTFHTIDYLAGKRRKAVLRAEYRAQSPAFAAIDRIAHAVGHKPSGERTFGANAPADLGRATARSEAADVPGLVNAAADFLRKMIREQDARQDQPINDTYYVVVAFDRNAEGDVRPGMAQEAISAGAAGRLARALAAEHAGAIAFSRRGDPATGEFQDATILAQFGEVDLSALSG